MKLKQRDKPMTQQELADRIRRLERSCLILCAAVFLLAFFGIFILRRRNDATTRPFSTPLYPLVPIIAIAGGIFVLVSEIINDPAGVVLFVGIVIVGLPILYFVKRLDAKRLH